VNVAPIRVEPVPGQWVVIGLTFLWESFVAGFSYSDLQRDYAGDYAEMELDPESVETEVAPDGDPVTA
jgi:hypothetical protein